MDHNTAFGTGGSNAANGGAVFAQNASAVSVTNSTFAENIAAAGGGFFELNDGMTNAVSFLNSTIADNTGGGILVTMEFATRPTLLPVLENTLVAGNTSGDNVQGMVQSNGHNLIEDPTGASGLTSGDITGQDPRLGPLTNNGGLLPTLALLPGSPAIDAGDSAVATAAGLTADQRGPLFARITGAAVDIGAFEVQPMSTMTPINVTKPAPPAEITGATVLHTQKKNKRGKPVGKSALTGFQLSFNTTMNVATVMNQSNYSLGKWHTKRVKRKTISVLQPLAFTVIYHPSMNSVELLLGGKQTFPQGGQITLIGTPPSGISDSAGGFLDGTGTGTGGNNAVYTISSNARGLILA
jgi:hypothetical protein